MQEDVLRHGGKAARIAEHLDTCIRRGRFAPGQRLIENDLTVEFGASRGPVREALKQLAAEGLVEIVPNRGAVVRRLTRREACELFEIRTELEAMAARAAAGHMADRCVRDRFEADIAPIREDAPRHSTQDYIGENSLFHAAVLAASGNRQLVVLNEKLQLSLIMAQIGSAFTSGIIAASLAEHRAIADAILDGDARAADTAMRDHLTRALAFTREMPAHLFGPDRTTVSGG